MAVTFAQLHRRPSKQDIDDFRRRQFADTRAQLLESKGGAIDAVEAALAEDKISLAIRAQKRSAEHAARKLQEEKKERRRCESAKRAVANAGLPAKEGVGDGAGAAGRRDESVSVLRGGDNDRDSSIFSTKVSRAGVVEADGAAKRDGIRGGARATRALHLKNKAGMLEKLPPINMLQKDVSAIAKKMKAETDVAMGEIEMQTFQRVAALLQFLLDQVWIEMIPPVAGGWHVTDPSLPTPAHLAASFQRLPYGGKPLDYTRHARAAQKKRDDGDDGTPQGPPPSLSTDAVMDGAWCVVDLPPGLSEGDSFTLTVGGLEGSGRCRAGCAGEASLEVVLSPLMHYAQKEWMVTAGSDEDVIDTASDLLECARKHADFYKRDLYVTTAAIIKFLQAELRMPRKGSTGRKAFIFTAQELRKRLAEEGYLAKPCADKNKVKSAAGAHSSPL